MTDDERAIRSLVDEWMAATRAGDLPAVLKLMADDVIFMVPGRPPFGKEEFAAGSAAMKDVHIDGRSDIQELHVMGGWAFLRNFIDLTMTRAGSGLSGEASHSASARRRPDVWPSAGGISMGGVPLVATVTNPGCISDPFELGSPRIRKWDGGTW